MPELPEIEALTQALGRVVPNEPVISVVVAQASALKTFSPPIDSLIGSHITGFERRGKLIVARAEKISLVLHLARAGWLQWRESSGPGRARRPGETLHIRFLSGGSLELIEMGTQKRVAIYCTHEDPRSLPVIAHLGVDPLSAEFTAELLEEKLKMSRNQLKTFLCDQSNLAGIGNAYSDEILYEARLSPFKLASRTDSFEAEELYRAIRETLEMALARATASNPISLKSDKKRAMRVHGRAGEGCQRCGDSIRTVSFSERSLEYCPTCQTGGQIFADRRLSRLLK